MKSVEELLSSIDEIMDKAKSFPFGGDKCIVDSRELAAVLDEIRMNLPQEIRKAKGIVSERGMIIAEANKEADEIVSKAQERARALVNQEVILKEAKEKADKLLAAAEEQANELLRGTFAFSDNILLETENTVNQNLESVRQARKNLRSAAKAKAASNKAARQNESAPAPTAEEASSEE